MFGYKVLQSYNELEMLVYNYIMEQRGSKLKEIKSEQIQSGHLCDSPTDSKFTLSLAEVLIDIRFDLDYNFSVN